MKLIIDIPEEMISLIKDKSVECFNIIHYGQVLDAIYNGTPIPDNATVCDIEQIMDEMQSLAKGNPDYVNGVMNCIDILNKHIGGKA